MYKLKNYLPFFPIIIPFTVIFLLLIGAVTFNKTVRGSSDDSLVVCTEAEFSNEPELIAVPDQDLVIIPN